MLDVSLIKHVKSGDPKAFEELVFCTQQRALNIAFIILDNMPDAEEVVQEAYIQVYQKIHDLRLPEAFNSWFGKIVSNLAIRKSRSKGYCKTVPIEDDLRIEDAFRQDPEALVLDKMHQDELMELLLFLPEEYRLTLLLKEWEGYSYQEISEILDIPLGTVKSRIFSARRKLAMFLKDMATGKGGSCNA